jgi:hypothetical protein
MKIKILFALFFISKIACGQNTLDNPLFFKLVDSVALNEPGNTVIKWMTSRQIPMKKMDMNRSAFLGNDTVYCLKNLKTIEPLFSFKGKRKDQFYKKNEKGELDLMIVFYDKTNIKCYNLRTGMVEIDIPNPFSSTNLYYIKYIDDNTIFFYEEHRSNPIPGQGALHEKWYTLEKYSISSKTFSPYWESMHFTSFGGLNDYMRFEIHSVSNEDYLLAMAYPFHNDKELVAINTLLILCKKSDNKWLESPPTYLANVGNTFFSASEYSYNLDKIIYRTINVDPLLEDRTRKKTDYESNLVTISTKNSIFSVKPLPKSLFGYPPQCLGNYYLYYDGGQNNFFSKSLNDFFLLPRGDLNEFKVPTGAAQYIPNKNKYYYYVQRNNKIMIYEFLTQNL